MVAVAVTDAVAQIVVARIARVVAVAVRLIDVGVVGAVVRVVGDAVDVRVADAVRGIAVARVADRRRSRRLPGTRSSRRGSCRPRREGRRHRHRRGLRSKSASQTSPTPSQSSSRLVSLVGGAVVELVVDVVVVAIGVDLARPGLQVAEVADTVAIDVVLRRIEVERTVVGRVVDPVEVEVSGRCRRGKSEERTRTANH